MLLYLTDSLIVDKADAEYEGILNSAKYLALAYMEKSHLLRGDYNVLEWLSRQFADTDQTTYKVYRQLEKYYSTFTIPNFIRIYVQVTRSMPHTDCIKDRNGIVVRPICYKYFYESSKIQKMVVVGEALHDLKFYKFITERYMAVHNINALLEINCENGGGTGVAQTTRKYKDKHCMAASIIDSDSKYKGHKAADGTTRCICEKEWLSYNLTNEIFFSKILEVQEIENLIPKGYIDRMDIWTGQNKENKEVYDRLFEGDTSDCILPYYDLKNGLVKDNNMWRDEKYVDYVLECCKCLGLVYTKEDIETFPNGKVICKGLHKGLLKKTLECIEQGKLDNVLLDSLKPYQIQGWRDVAVFLLNMGCVEKKEI